MKTFLRTVKRIALMLAVVVGVVVVPMSVATLYEKARASFLSATEKQIEDIARLEYLIRHEFGGFETLVDVAAFEARLTDLRTRVGADSGLTTEVFQLELIKLMASFRDSHTGVYQYREMLRDTYAFRVEWFDGSFYLVAGRMDDDKWLGSRVTSINGHSPQEAYDRLSAYANSPNPAGRAQFMAPFASLPAVLFHEGLATTRNQTTLTVESAAGESRTFSYDAMPRANLGALADYRTLAKKYAEAKQPLMRAHPDRNYWFEYLEQEGVLYVRYSLCVDQGNIEQFWQELFQVADAKRPAKFVLDIRGNPGGDSKNSVTLVNEIRRRPWLNARGRLFTITDRGTGSAAISLTSSMERQTRAILVGEPPGDRANTTSDPTFFTLPHSGVTLLLPNLYSLHSHVHDRRVGIEPELAVTTTLAGDGYLQDPAMALILGYAPTPERAATTPPSLPAGVAGTYAFSPLRNLSLSRTDGGWTLAIDGWVDTPVLERDSRFVTAQHGIELALPDNPGGPLIVRLDGSTITAPRLPDGQSSILKSIDDGKFAEAQTRLLSLQSTADPLPALNRTLLHSRIYEAYASAGLDQALATNQVNRALFPDDPVVPIIDFELYQRTGGHLRGRTKATFSTIGNLVRRYYRVITTDRIMNDDYNAFIGS